MNIELETKPDFDRCMQRIYAWYEQEIIDRAPIRFTTIGNDTDSDISEKGRTWPSLKEKWWDTEYQLDRFEFQLKHSNYLAETFPVYWPNLGPEVFTAFYGVELDYKEYTSYAIPVIEDYSQLNELKFDRNNIYFRKIEKMTFAALERCEGRYLVGYTDLHPGLDCAAAFRDPQQLCLDFILEPENVKKLIEISSKDFQKVYDHFDSILKKHGQLSVAWLGVPSFERMHIPSCDFSSMISPDQFEEFALDVIKEEMRTMDHNIFHVDGKGVANHIDFLLDLPEINAIQWVQGAGDSQPIMQWVPLIKKIQSAGKSVMVDLQVSELESFMKEINPEGIMLCISATKGIQPEIMKRVKNWN